MSLFPEGGENINGVLK
jgi:hypothetical protein